MSSPTRDTTAFGDPQHLKGSYRDIYYKNPDPQFYAKSKNLPPLTPGDILQGVKDQYKRDVSRLSDLNTVRPLPREIYDELIPSEYYEYDVWYLNAFLIGLAGTFLITAGQIMTTHVKGFAEFIGSRTKQALLFTLGLPTGPKLPPGPSLPVYIHYARLATKNRFQYTGRVNYLMFFSRIPAMYLGMEAGWFVSEHPEASVYGAVVGYLAFPPALYGIRPPLFPHGYSMIFKTPGPILGSLALLTLPLLRWSTWKDKPAPEWVGAMSEAWAGLTRKWMLKAETAGKFDEVLKHFDENRGWEMRWQAMEKEMIDKYTMDYKVVKSYEFEEVSALNQKKKNLQKEQLLYRIEASRESQEDNAHRASLRVLALEERKLRRERILRIVPFANVWRRWSENQITLSQVPGEISKSIFSPGASN